MISSFTFKTQQNLLKNFFKVIDTFSSISSYTINWNKSIILPITEHAWDSAAQESLLSLPVGNIRYLGINISPRLSELFSLNHIPLLQEIQNDLIRWSKLPLSLIGGIACIKMKILPRLNYLFSNIPVIPPDKWFWTLDSLIIKFYWNNKKPKIKHETLQKSKPHGGLNTPNFQTYFIANQLQYLTKWIKPSPNHLWIKLEQASCNNISLSDLPALSPSLKKHNCF